MTDSELPEPGYTSLCGVDLKTLAQLEELASKRQGEG